MLSDSDRQAIRAEVLALPPLSPDELEALAATLENVRAKRIARQAPAA